MATGLVIYYSKTGNTKKMAQVITEAMCSAGVDTVCKTVTETTVDDMLKADAVVIGSPVYYGHMAGEIKTLLDKSAEKHGLLDGKVAGAFASSANIGGGNETAIIGIIETLLIHGMVVQGDPQGDHYGPVSINQPDERAISQCRRRGKRIAELTLKLFG